MQFGEGPVYLGDLAMLIWIDTPNSTLLCYCSGQVSVFRSAGGCLLAWLTWVIEAERRYPAPCPHNGGIGPGYFG